MRILFLHKFNFNNSWGGSASYLRALYLALTKMGHNVNVVSPNYPDKYGFTTCRLPFEMTLTFGPEKRPGETTLDELTTEQFESMAAQATETIAAREFLDTKPDLIIANHINLMALVAWRLSNRFDVPYRIISYGTDTQLLLKDRRYCHIFGTAARGAEKILSISGFVAKYKLLLTLSSAVVVTYAPVTKGEKVSNVPVKAVFIFVIVALLFTYAAPT